MSPETTDCASHSTGHCVTTALGGGWMRHPRLLCSGRWLTCCCGRVPLALCYTSALLRYPQHCFVSQCCSRLSTASCLSTALCLSAASVCALLHVSALLLLPFCTGAGAAASRCGLRRTPSGRLRRACCRYTSEAAGRLQGVTGHPVRGGFSIRAFNTALCCCTPGQLDYAGVTAVALVGVASAT